MGRFTYLANFARRNAVLISILLMCSAAFAADMHLPSTQAADITADNLTASSVVVSDGNKKLVSSSVSSTTLGYLDIGSSLTSLLAAKAPLASPTFTGTVTVPLTASTVPYVDASSALVSSAVTPTELGYVSGVTSSLCGINQSCTLTNKTLTAPAINGANFNFGTATDTNRLLLPSDTTTNLNLLANTAGLLAFDSTQNKPVFNDGTQWTAVGSGSGSGVKTYISDGDFESAYDTSKVFTYDDGTSYVDGTGGTPSAITIARNSTTPLAGSYDLEISKAASDCTGEGVTILTETIDRAKRGQAINFRFLYDFSDANYTAGDVQIKAYDVTNSAILAVIPISGTDSSGGLYQSSDEAYVQVPTASTTAQVRLSLHCTTDSATASAWNGYIDEAVFTPTDTVPVPIISDLGTETWVDNQGNATTTVRLTRNGNTLTAKGTAIFTGAMSGSYTATIPDKYTPDSAEYDVSGTRKYELGPALLRDSSSGTWQARALYVSANTITINSYSENSTYTSYGSLSSSSPFIWASGDSITWTASWIVSGWDSGASISTSELAYKTAKVTAAISTASHTSNGNWQDIAWTESLDSTNSFDGTSFKAKENMRVCFSGTVGWASSSTGSRTIGYVKNSDTVVPVVNLTSTGSGNVYQNFNFCVDLVKDDTVKIQGVQSSGGTLSYLSASALFIDAQPDYKVFATYSQNVAARYHGSSSSVSGSYSAVTYSIKDFDTTSSYSGGTYTVPVSGKYLISAAIYIAGSSATSSTQVAIFKNGTNVSEGTTNVISSASSFWAQVTDTVSCDAGDTIVIKAADGRTSPTITSSNTKNLFSITKVAD